MIEIKKHSLYKSMEIDSVLSSVFNIYLKKFWTLFIFSFIGVFMIQLVVYKLGFMEMYAISDPDELLKVFSSLIHKISILSVSSVVIYGVLNTFLINYIIKSDFDPKVHIGDLFAESLKKYAVHMIFFLILSILIFIVGFFLGLIAFIVGAFVAAIYLGAVLLPGGSIIVVEEKNAIETVGRTFSLTHKDFWPTIGVFVLFILIMVLISFIISALIAIPFVIMFFGNLKETGSFLDALNFQTYDIGIWIVVVNSIVSALTYPLYAILSVVLYFKLKYTEDQTSQLQ
ncbi:MAG: hypothetical protein KAQ75_08875 [Bacteroidales bacterium]|nr:hypothetical protein [Bacteroidales bacterium]